MAVRFKNRNRSAIVLLLEFCGKTIIRILPKYFLFVLCTESSNQVLNNFQFPVGMHALQIFIVTVKCVRANFQFDRELS